MVAPNVLPPRWDLSSASLKWADTVRELGPRPRRWTRARRSYPEPPTGQERTAWHLPEVLRSGTSTNRPRPFDGIRRPTPPKVIRRSRMAVGGGGWHALAVVARTTYARAAIRASVRPRGSPGHGSRGLGSEATGVDGLAQSAENVASMRSRIAGSVTRMPHSRLSLSDTHERFSEPTNARAAADP